MGAKITKLQKQIVDAHLTASIKDSFDYPALKCGEEPKIKTKEQVIQLLAKGKTIYHVHKEIETRYVSITSQLYASPHVFGLVTDAYKRDYTKGFKTLLNQLNIR